MFGSFTGVGADNGSRLAAGGLNNPVVYDRVGSGFSIGQMITDFGRTSNLVGMAKLQAEAQDQVTETTRAQILLATSSAYFAVLRAQAVLKVADQTVAARQMVADQVTALAESNLKSTLDVSFANVNLAEAKLLQVQAQNDLKAAEADLATAMGLPGETAFVLAEEPMPPPLPDRVDDLIREAIQRSSRVERSAPPAERRGALHQGRARALLSQPRRHRHGRFRARRLHRHSRPLRSHRHERDHPDLQWRLVQGPPDRSRIEGQGRHRERQRPAEPRHPRRARGLSERHCRIRPHGAHASNCSSRRNSRSIWRRPGTSSGWVPSSN